MDQECPLPPEVAPPASVPRPGLSRRDETLFAHTKSQALGTLQPRPPTWEWKVRRSRPSLVLEKPEVCPGTSGAPREAGAGGLGCVPRRDPHRPARQGRLPQRVAFGLRVKSERSRPCSLATPGPKLCA